MDNSRLSHPLAELRNTIFQLALIHNKPVNLSYDQRGLRHAPRDPREKHPLGLVKSCKALYKETRAVFYANNIFIADDLEFLEHCREVSVLFHGSQAQLRRNLEKSPHLTVSVKLGRSLSPSPRADDTSSSAMRVRAQAYYGRMMIAAYIFTTYDRMHSTGIDTKACHLDHKYEDAEAERVPHDIMAQHERVAAEAIMTLLDQQGWRLAAHQ